MPLLEKPLRRKGFAAFTYFKGKPEEVSNASLAEVHAPFERAGYKLVNPEQAVAKLKKIAMDVGGTQKKTITFMVETDKGLLNMQAKASPRGRVLIKQHPLTHGIRYPRRDPNPLQHNTFMRLRRILRDGFTGHASPNTLSGRRRDTPALPYENPAKGFTWRDAYSIEIMAPAKEMVYEEEYGPIPFVEAATPQQITKIIITISPLSGNIEVGKKIRWHKEQLKGWPLVFIGPHGPKGSKTVRRSAKRSHNS